MTQSTDRPHQDLQGLTVVAADGSRIGKVDEVYTDNASGDPSFITVTTGLFGTRRTFVPTEHLAVEGEEVRVPYTKEQVKDAPNVEPDGEITLAEQDRLYAHYGVGGAAPAGLDDDRVDHRADDPADDRTDERREVVPGDDAIRDHQGTRDLHGVGQRGEPTTSDDDRAARSGGGRHAAPVEPDLPSGSGDTDGRGAGRDIGDVGSGLLMGTASAAAAGGHDQGAGAQADVIGTDDQGLPQTIVSPTGERMRLRRVRVTEMRTIEVPVVREEIRVERDAPDDAGTGR